MVETMRIIGVNAIWLPPIPNSVYIVLVEITWLKFPMSIVTCIPSNINFVSQMYQTIYACSCIVQNYAETVKLTVISGYISGISCSTI